MYCCEESFCVSGATQSGFQRPATGERTTEVHHAAPRPIGSVKNTTPGNSASLSWGVSHSGLTLLKRFGTVFGYFVLCSSICRTSGPQHPCARVLGFRQLLPHVHHARAFPLVLHESQGREPFPPALAAAAAAAESRAILSSHCSQESSVAKQSRNRVSGYCMFVA